MMSLVRSVKDVFREAYCLYTPKTTLLNLTLQGSTAVTFMSPSTFFGLHLYRNFSKRSPFLARECLNSCSKCAKQLTYLNKSMFSFYLFVKHSHTISVQKLKRSGQALILCRGAGYDRLYFWSLVDDWFNNISRRGCTWWYLLGVVIFAWGEEKVSDSEIERVSNELSMARDFVGQKNADWELVVNKADVQIWRKAMPKSGLYQYKVSGTYKDISARSFYQIQVDLEFRRQWDKHVISLGVIDKDNCSGSEVVHWVTEFPYPMSSREYVYVRRHEIDQDKKLMVIISRGIPHHPALPVCSNHVRVTDYSSEMVIKPHTSFDENGFDYMLTYFDDPKSAIPKVALSWAASSGIPDFVDKLYDAAVILQHKRKAIPTEASFKNDSLENIEVEDETKLPM